MGTQGTDMIAFRLPFCLGGVFLAFLMLFCSQSWAACSYYGGTGADMTNWICTSFYGCSSVLPSRPDDCTSYTTAKCTIEPSNSCPSNTFSAGGGWIVRKTIFDGSVGCATTTGGYVYRGCSYSYCCDNQCEADSVQNGGFILECQYDVTQNKYYRWICPGDLNCSSCGQQFYSDQTQCQEAFCQDNPNDLSCRPECDTTTLNNLIHNCENQMEGSPHFRCNDQGNVVGYCDMCDQSGDTSNIYHGYTNPYMQGEIEAKREQCCNGSGSIGDFRCLASANGCYGANCDWKGSNGGASSFSGNCDLSKPVAMGLTCEEYGTGEDSGSGNEDASSSSADTSAAGSSGTAPGDSAGDFEYNYNDSLHKIIDSLGKLISISQLMLEQMGTGGDTIIVNTERDTVINNINVDVSAPNVYFNDSVYKTQLGNLEAIQGRIKQILTPADTTLQTSLYDTIALSFNKISAQFDSALLYGFRLDSVLFDENLVNVGDYGYQDTVEKYMGTRMAFGDYADSIAHAWGADTITAGFDSSYSYGQCAPGDSACLNGNGEGLGMGDFLGDGDSIVQALGDSLKKNVKKSEDSLPAIWSEYWDSTKKYAPYTDFEEKLMDAIGATIPNTNTCPEHCGKFDINLQQLSWVRNTIGIDFGICVPISTFGNINVLLFLRLILRILTIVSCLYITLWEVTTKRGKIGL